MNDEPRSFGDAPGKVEDLRGHANFCLRDSAGGRCSAGALRVASYAYFDST